MNKWQFRKIVIGPFLNVAFGFRKLTAVKVQEAFIAKVSWYDKIIPQLLMHFTIFQALKITREYNCVTEFIINAEVYYIKIWQTKIEAINWECIF